MPTNIVSLNLVGVDTDVDEGGEGVKLVLHGEGGVAVAINMTARTLLEMSTLVDQVALSVVTAQCLARKGVEAGSEREASSEPAKPVVVPVYLVQKFDILHTQDGGCVPDVEVLRGNHLRLALSAEQAGLLFTGEARGRVGPHDVQ